MPDRAPEDNAMTFFLVRHGQSTGLEDGEYENNCSDGIRPNHSRRWDDVLTPRGRGQVKMCAERLRKAGEQSGQVLSRVLCSPEIICLKTAEVIAEELGLPATVDRGLSEQVRRERFDTFCPIEGLMPNEHNVIQRLAKNGLSSTFRCCSPGDELAPCPANYEEDPDFAARAAAVVNSLATFRGANGVVLVLSDSVCKILMQALGISDDDSWCWAGVSCSWAILQRQMNQAPGVNTAAGQKGNTACEWRLSQPFSPPYDTTPDSDWVTGHVKTWTDTIQNALTATPPENDDGKLRILEIGSWEGLSACWFLNHLKPSELWLVDHFDSLQTSAGLERRRKLEFNTGLSANYQSIGTCKIKVLPYFSTEAIAQHIDPAGVTFGFVYIDGDHRAKQTLRDALEIWPSLERGGLLMFDDYEWDREEVSSPNHPRRGIDAFVSVMAEELEVTYKGYQLIVRKTVRQEFPSRGPYLAQSRIVPVVFAVDEAYVKPLAVALRSLYESCTEPSQIHVMIAELGGGISDDSKQRLETICRSNTVGNGNSLQWLRNVKHDAHYAKLHPGEVLPTCYKRVLYLDADILVRHDVSELFFDESVESAPLSCVMDVGFPTGHDQISLPDEKTWGLHNHYFNAGVMLINTHVFREASSRLLEIAKKQDWRFKDQDVLNVFFLGKWLPLPLRWNVQGIDSYLTFRVAGNGLGGNNAILTKDEEAKLVTEPAIVHFTGINDCAIGDLGNKFCRTPTKPWSGLCEHRYTSAWYEVLDKTPFGPWRPSRAKIETSLVKQVAGYVQGIANETGVSFDP